MRHTGAAERFNERFFDHAVFHVERKLAGALLRRAPAYAMGKAANIGDLFCLDPLALLRNGRRVMLCAFCDAEHLFNFARILHLMRSSFEYSSFHLPFHPAGFIKDVKY